jgi:hypothetical protein
MLYAGGSDYNFLITGPKLQSLLTFLFHPYAQSSCLSVQSPTTSTATSLVKATSISHLDNAPAFHETRE